MERFAFESVLVKRIPIGLVPDGLRVDVHFDGDVTEGPMRGGKVTGVDYLLMRRDGVAVMDVRDVITLPGGGTVAVRAGGYVTPAFEMPPLEFLVTPDFEWPDVEVPLHGAAMLQTAEPSLVAYNRTVFFFTGSVNMGKGTLRIAAESFADVAVP